MGVKLNFVQMNLGCFTFFTVTRDLTNGFQKSNQCKIESCTKCRHADPACFTPWPIPSSDCHHSSIDRPWHCFLHCHCSLSIDRMNPSLDTASGDPTEGGRVMGDSSVHGEARTSSTGSSVGDCVLEYPRDFFHTVSGASPADAEWRSLCL